MDPHAEVPVNSAAARIVEALSYLGQCRREKRPLAVLTARDGASLAEVLQEFADNLPAGTRIARTPAPTDSGHAFLETVLSQFGFDPFDASTDDLLRLLMVVLRQGSDSQGGAVIFVEEAQTFGPRVLELLRDLLRAAEGWATVPLVVLTGSDVLNRVMDSVGMAAVAHLAGDRFDLDRGPGGPAGADVAGRHSAGPGTGPAFLVLSRGGTELGRVAVDQDRLLIGRGEYSDLTLPSRFVSRQHALLLRDGNGDWLVDLRSTNGTIVNAQLIERRRLADGDLINIGNFLLRYENASAAGRHPGPRAAPPEEQASTAVMRSLQALRAVPEVAPARSNDATSAA